MSNVATIMASLISPSISGKLSKCKLYSNCTNRNALLSYCS